jgi:hypothetical protein
MNKRLQVSDKDLPRVLGEVLHNKETRQGKTAAGDTSYTETDAPVPLTPDNQVKWRDWAVGEYGKFEFATVLADMVLEAGISTTMTGTLAQPKHYLLTAAQCKLNNGE